MLRIDTTSAARAIPSERTAVANASKSRLRCCQRPASTASSKGKLTQFWSGPATGVKNALSPSPYRRKLLRKINSEFGPLERLLAADLSYTAFWYYIAYLAAGIEPAEARRLARRSELLGEDATNYE